MADEKKAKKTRTVKPVYVVLQVTDDAGNTIKLTKENVAVVSTHKDAGELLDMLDAGGLPEGAFYKRIALG
ncbi:hypothetical protein LCGC14_1105650 [marine sediment metagenome]|uniref:Uncharacterized protein n=1 Tax=marine sediment metagenome TaxID=412755 RepID=A0A0F9MW69_9ZZZZ